MSTKFESRTLTKLDREQSAGYGAAITGDDRIVLRGAEIIFGRRQVQVLFEGRTTIQDCLSDAVWYLNI